MRGRKSGQSLKLSIDQMTLLVELTKKGESRKNIASKFNCNPKTVYNYQKRLGIV